MDSRKPPLIVIVGPTASGKSELAVRLARKFNGEIVSADSRQIYRGLNIGSGKVRGRWRTTRSTKQEAGSKKTFQYKGVAHHCIDFVPPRRTFTVAEFKPSAEAAIHDITRRGRIPILVGGTGFWIDAVAYDFKLPAIPPNPALRRRLAGKPAGELLTMLQRLDPQRARTIEQKNPRRLIRAIEIARALGEVPELKKRSPYRILWIGVALPIQTLKRRIRKRLLKRIRQGMVAEAKRLRSLGLPWKRFYELGLEYRFLADYLRQKITMPRLIAGLEAAIGRYARRQMAWFRRNPEIRWVSSPRQAEHLARTFLSRDTAGTP